MATDGKRTALVTGGNRGIGLEVCAQLSRCGLDVVLCSRHADRGQKAADSLARKGVLERVMQLDMTDPRSIDRSVTQLKRDGVEIDVLINNAGVYPPGNAMISVEDAFRETMEVHYFGPLRLSRALIPGMQKRRYGRIVNVSSGSGSFGEGLEGPAAYCISKAAMNAFTFKLAEAVGRFIKVNTLCPGWVRTRMGGPRATRGVKKGAETITWLATLPDDGPSGGFFRDKEQIPW